MAAQVERKGVWLWLVVVALSVALATGLTWTAATNSLSTQASRLDAVDLALGSAAVTRASASQAVLIATNQSAGTASLDALASAITELLANSDAYQQLSAETGIASSGVTASGQRIATLIQQGAVDLARNELEGSLQAAYLEDIEALTIERGALVADIDSAASIAGSMAGWLRVVAVVAVPMAAALIAHLMGRRRLREERAQLLDVVRDVGDEAAIADELLADASHRLRTPLTSIYGLADVLAQSKRVTGLEKELASLVRAEASEMRRIADDILVLDQMRTGSLKATAGIVALPGIVDEATSWVAVAGADIKVECPEVWVLSDPSKVKHIIRNLVANAVSHGAEPIFVEVSEVDGRVECEVVDHGPGLQEGVDPDSGIFSASGYGMRIAYRLSEVLGANLTYRRDGGQTRFCLAFAEESDSDPPGAESPDA